MNELERVGWGEGKRQGCGDGSESQRLDVYAQHPEFGSPASHRRSSLVVYACIPGLGSRNRWLPGTHWLASLTKMSSSKFNERPYLKK